MDKVHKETLQVSKEIVVKFIETGRVSPANFAEVFPSVHAVVRETVLNSMLSVPLSRLEAEDKAPTKQRNDTA